MLRRKKCSSNDVALLEYILNWRKMMIGSNRKNDQNTFHLIITKRLNSTVTISDYSKYITPHFNVIVTDRKNIEITFHQSQITKLNKVLDCILDNIDLQNDFAIDVSLNTSLPNSISYLKKARDSQQSPHRYTIHFDHPDNNYAKRHITTTKLRKTLEKMAGENKLYCQNGRISISVNSYIEKVEDFQKYLNENFNVPFSAMEIELPIPQSTDFPVVEVECEVMQTIKINNIHPITTQKPITTQEPKSALLPMYFTRTTLQDKDFLRLWCSFTNHELGEKKPQQEQDQNDPSSRVCLMAEGQRFFSGNKRKHSDSDDDNNKNTLMNSFQSNKQF